MYTPIMSTIVLILVVCFPVLIHCQGVQVETIPPQISNTEGPFISAIENTINVTVVCDVTFNGGQVVTAWRLIKDGVQDDLMFNSDGTGINPDSSNFFVTGELFSLDTTRANMTILTFDSSLDMAVLWCGSGSDFPGEFNLRITKPPVLYNNNSEVQDVTEGTPFSFNIQVTEGFPIVIISYQWHFNGAVISEGGSNPNTTIYPNITFTSVNRSNSGNYTITVNHDGGIANGSFQLNVQYGPEAVPQPGGPFYRLSGDNIMLISYQSINGNPLPSSTWSNNDGSIINGGRFDTSIAGQLSITSLSITDTGNYTNTLMNTVNNISNTIELIVAVIPSQPRDVSGIDIGAESVNISWRNPMELGTPAIAQFRIVAVSSINAVNTTIDASNNIDPNFINTFMLTGLKPNTNYTISITALTTVDQLGLLTSNSSNMVILTTTLGPPSINTASVVNINGNLTVSWSFLHTGGNNLDMITVQCSSTADDNDNINITISSSTDPLSIIIYCINDNDCMTTDNISFGPVIAGMNYSCLITADNNIGEDYMRTNYILATTGIPSVPVITNVIGGTGEASITMRVNNYGVTMASEFILTVRVYDQGNNIINTILITPVNINNPVLTITVDNLPEGTISFTISSSNIYGIPILSTSNITDPVFIQPINNNTFTTTTTTTTTILGPSTTTTFITVSSTTANTVSLMVSSSSTNTIPTNTITNANTGLSGGAIAGIIIAIIILVAIIIIVVFIIVYIIYQNRGDSYRVEGGKVFVEEHDIDLGTVLQDRNLSVDNNNKQDKQINETTTTPPKQEIHYADLADFAPKNTTNTPTATETAKPMPIEEVQYAVIRPQDLKQNGSDDN